MNTRASIRYVAGFEAFKGVVVLCAASGLLLLLHHDLHAAAASVIAHLHLNPASRYPAIFLDAAANLQDARLATLALGAAAYAALRFVEAYGLFRRAAWAELLAAASGAVYVPFEVAHLLRRPDWLSVAALALNVAVVSLMVAALLHRRRSTGERLR
ncbi:MAG: DUF2127 domain-containing protein, partial [Comamonadaceae bacterium]